MERGKPRIFSGIQPSGRLCIGNYIGALRNWVNLQDEDTHESIYCVVDMHAITVRQNPKELMERTLDVAALYIAVGIDPGKNTIFIQSHVPQHAELSWVLNCFTYVGELSRMTQFKEKSQKHEDNINAGLYDYPVLMAADILLYDTNLVPVGEDQRQHLELTRDVAARMNGVFPDLFTVPEVFMGKVGARVMDLADPTRKMSKSDDTPGSVKLLDTPDVIRKKFRRCVTDSVGIVRRSPDQPGVTNLIGIYAALRGVAPEAVEAAFEGKGYGAFKDAVADAVIDTLSPIQERFYTLRKDEAALKDILKQGAEQASAIAEGTLRRVHDAVGFIGRG